MAKYDPLYAYLRRQKTDAVDLTFRDMERLIGAILPKAGLSGAWWGPDAGVQSRAWVEAGFEARPDPKSERVLFVRLLRDGI